MSAGTLTVTNNSAAVNGTVTAFTTDLKTGDFIGVIIGGTPYTLVVSEIASDTSLTLGSAYTGPDASGVAWYAVPATLQVAITQKVLDDVARMTRGMILDKANWQEFYTASGDIIVNLPDNSQVTGPSWPAMQKTISDGINGKAASGANKDITSLSGLTTALSIAQGGTGQNNAQAFLTNAGMISTYNSFTLPFTDRNMRVVVDSVVTTTNASGEGTVNYPNTFANVCIACIPVIAYQSGISIMVINYNSNRITGFDYAVFNGTNRQTNSTVRINYIAIGF
ncbi:hypothetical protein ABW286_13980 [Erwinia papayae]|uniref:Tail fiber protein n=1 Tax=Erwinia papayae TaxID=206499 RepID=A0ABV3N387_9GAMM